MRKLSAFKAGLIAASSTLSMATSCKSEHSTFETLLINKQKCWILIQSPPEELEPNSIILACTRFYENGKFQAMGMDGKKDKPYQSIILDRNRASAPKHFA